ncbi:hypothetical protein K9M47_02380 [Candidatus Gracilibacteria bacterium]|nr:hypothetical protein [Candidatus Gracilibacteria bacterium]MCF7898990.1 hypothetical protein [Candidatus Paceibacterota bacterium]
MIKILVQVKNKLSKVKGFVLPYTLLIAAIMILITTGISTILIKQIYFSQVARESQLAYYAADDAVACTILIDETYADINGVGIFPNDATSINYDDPMIDMENVLQYTNEHRADVGYTPLASDLFGSTDSIKCSQSVIFDPSSATSEFVVDAAIFSHEFEDTTVEDGRSSSFKMKMDLGGGEYRCAKVTINKTFSYRQIVAQGYSRCDGRQGAIERAVVDTTLLK